MMIEIQRFNQQVCVISMAIDNQHKNRFFIIIVGIELGLFDEWI